LHLALKVLGVGPGDEVITTPMTFVATVNVIEIVGAKPVLVDVEKDTLNISPTEVEKALSPRTRVILPVHFGGHPADLFSLEKIAEEKGIYIVEDAAHALPARIGDRRIGSGKNLTAFSFYATKNITTGEGGMLTGPEELIEKARILSLHGMSRNAYLRYHSQGNWFYEVTEPGYKYNMTDIQASLGIAQLKKLRKFQERRREIVARYHSAFSGREELIVPVEREGVEHAWHLYPLRLRLSTLKISRDQFIDELRKRNIGTSVHFIPVHLHPYYREKYGYNPEDFPVAYESFQQIFSLPLHPALSDEDVEDVIEAVLDLLKQYRR
jgi:dTDP-4-amino-4,6-dideoxygalactose transaminase